MVISTAILSFVLWLAIYYIALRPVKVYYRAQNLFRDHQYQEAQELFASTDYRDSSQMAEELKKIEDEDKYTQAVAHAQEGLYEQARAEFLELSDYKDSSDYAKLMTASLDEKKAEEQYETDPEAGLETYDKALRVYDELGNTLNGAQLAKKLRYRLAKELIDDKEYQKALEYLKALGDYKDSARLAEWTQEVCDIYSAIELINQGEYGEAGRIADRLLQTDFDDIHNAAGKTQSLVHYCQAIVLMQEGDYPAAEAAFEELGDYLNSSDFLKEAEEDFRNGKYSNRAIIRNAEHFLGTGIEDPEADTFQGNELLVNTRRLYGCEGKFWAVANTAAMELKTITFRFFYENERNYKNLVERLTKDFGEPMMVQTEEKRSYSCWMDHLYGTENILALCWDHDFQLVLQIEPTIYLTDSSGKVLDIR